MSSRRNFLKATVLGGGLGWMGGGIRSDAATTSAETKRLFEPIRFGLIADIHKNHFPDVDQRLEAFMKRVEIEKPDFILSLGDFCFSFPENEAFAGRFAGSGVPAFHVLGNHELDKNSKSEAVSFLGMPAPYYSVDVKGYHLVILDPNFIYSDRKFIDYEKGNYFKHGVSVSYVNDAQCEWLRADLEATTLPTFLFSHQSLMHDNGGIPNRAYIKEILKQANEKAIRNGQGKKVFGCFNGHHHRDGYRSLDDIHYFSINSVSYFYAGYKVPVRFEPEVYTQFRSLDKSIPYKDPLFSFVSIDAAGTLSLQGTESEWFGAPYVPVPSPSVRYSQGEAIPRINSRKVLLT